jgi:hypothetical protein
LRSPHQRTELPFDCFAVFRFFLAVESGWGGPEGRFESAVLIELIVS